MEAQPEDEDIIELLWADNKEWTEAHVQRTVKGELVGRTLKHTVVGEQCSVREGAAEAPDR